MEVFMVKSNTGLSGLSLPLYIVMLIFLSSCATVDLAGGDGGPVETQYPATAAGDREILPGDRIIPPLKDGWEPRIIRDGYILPDEIQQLIVDSGIGLTESGRLTIKGKDFAPDCTGTVLAAYWGAGINPVKFFHLYQGNGVKRLADMGDDYDLTYVDQMPNPGDIIIWDDTYDKNEDGKWGDPYTHAGIVIDVAENGQISYMHYNYVKGVVIEKMNLKYPDTYQAADGTLLNSPMRMRAHRYIKPDAWLASHLVRGFIPMYMYPGIIEE
jgi:hypothetical protein